MTRRLLLGYLSLTTFVLVVLEIPLGITFARFERGSLISGVRRDAATLALSSEETLRTGKGPTLDSLVGAYRKRTQGRAVIVDVKGDVQADSDPLVPGSRNFLSRPEIARALANHENWGRRHSSSLHTDLLFVAVPITTGGQVHGAVRITYPLSFVESRIVRGWGVLAAVGFTVLVFVLLLSIQLARSITRPLRDLELAAGRLGEGELDTRVGVPDGPQELRVLARGFNDTADKLQRLVSSQRAFVADASHQLRTPLAALRLRLENVEAEAPGDVQEDIAAAINEVGRLARLVDGLLALARAENQSSRHEVIDLTALIADRRQTWEPLIEEHDVRLVSESAKSVWVVATPGHLEQVIDNLVANAVDVAPAGSTVTVRALAAARDETRDADMVELHIVDQGPGMPAEQRARAFDRFWRSKEARASQSKSKLGGSGLGLSIVQQLVVADGGEVVLLEAPGGGLDACVRLRAGAGPGGRARGGGRGRAGGRRRSDGANGSGVPGVSGGAARSRARAAKVAPPDAAVAEAAAEPAEPGEAPSEPALQFSSASPRRGTRSSEWRNRQTR